ncbi:MAG: dipeptidase [Bacteroidales bacterium]|nr:dipeptidase [Bacteroidales bacterium]MDD4385042.1 dipeptidase [Bacteroidales bacterium]MDY0196650.1 dipeptidase [Tenuifilaceae bacterium]
MKQLLIIIASTLLFQSCASSQPTDQELLDKAKKLHSEFITIDSHTDTPLMLMQDKFNVLSVKNNRRAKVTLEYMKEGGLDAVFFAVFIGQDDRTPEKYEEVHQTALAIFDSVHAAIGRYPEYAAIATNSDDAKRLKGEGKRAIYLGVENGYPIGKDLSKIDAYFNLGARYLTLCHTSNNDICDSSTDPKGAEHGGLSDFGEEVVKRLNHLGMMIDVSHISDSAFFQTLMVTNTPIIASHSNARAVCDNPRNLSDEMLLALKQNGGVIQMCLLSNYIKPDEPYPARDSARNALGEKYGSFRGLDPEIRKKAIEEWYAIDENFPQKLATVSNLVDHIDHVVKLIGIDHVGIGSDFDGGGGLADCYNVSQMHNITVELLRRGYSNSDIKKIWGENLLRVFKQVEGFART